MRRHRARYFRVLSEGFPAKHGRATARLADVAVDAYRSVMRLDIPGFYGSERFPIYLRLDPAVIHPRLFFQPTLVPSINYCVGDARSLRSPIHGGPHHVYGICHELGHLALFLVSGSSRDADTAVSEALADFLASSILQRIKKLIGAEAWPDAYEYWELDGIPSFTAITRGCQELHRPRSKATFEAAQWLLLRTASRYGVRKVGQAINKVRKSGRPVYLGTYKAFNTADFWNALGEVTSSRWLARKLRAAGLTRKLKL